MHFRKFCFLFFTFIFLFGSQIFASEKQLNLTNKESEWLKKHPEITLTGGILPPIDYLDKNGNQVSYAIEYVKVLGDLIGIKFNFVTDTWPDAISKLKNKKVDGIRYVHITKERKKFINFTKPYTRIIGGSVWGRKGILKIDSLDDIKDEVIGVIGNTSMHQYLLKHIPEKNIMVISKYDESIDMLISGKVDLIIGPMLTIQYYLSLKLIQDIELKFIIPELSGDVHIGIRKDWPELVSILNKAIETVPESVKSNIYNKWKFEETNDNLQIKLNVEEQAWLNEHTFVRIGADSNWAPIEFIDNNGRFKGLAIEYFKKIESSLGIKFQFIHTNWQELILRAKNKEVDLFTCVAKTSKREEYLVFTEPYIKMPAGIFTKQDVTYITDLNKIAGKKIAVVEGNAINDYLQANYPEINLLLVKKPEEGLQKVYQKKAFGFIDNIITTSYLISHKGYIDIKMAGEIPFVYEQCIGIRKDWPQFKGILKKIIDKIPESEKNVIYNKWVPVTSQKPINYKLIWQILVGSLILICMTFFWNRRLQYEVGKKTVELVNNEKRFKAIFNHRFQLTGLLEPDGKLLMANDNVCKMVGVDFKAIEGKYLWELPHFSHSKEIQRRIKEGVENAQKGNLVNFETTHPDLEGNLHYIDFSLTPARDEEGRVIYLVPEGHDITEKKQASIKLIESERNYREIYNTTSDAIVIHDSETGKIIDVNQTMENMFGYSKEELLHLSIGDISYGTPPYTQENALKYIKQTVIKGFMVFEWRACHKDGSCFWIEVALRNTTISGKGRILGVLRDITERKQMDEELRLVKHSIEASTIPFLWVQNDSYFFYANDSACKLLGYSLEELCSMNVKDIDPEFQNNRWVRFFEKLKLKKNIVFQSVNKNKKGEVFPVEITANYVEFESKEHVFAYINDIRDRIQLEEEQRVLEEQLQQSQKMEAIGTLAGGIAHDFNNILSPILGYSQIVHEDLPDDSKNKKMIKKVIEASTRASDLVKQILTFSRQTKQELKPLNISLVVKEAFKLIKASLPSTIEIKSKIQKDCGAVIADPTQIHQITMNIITNAYHAMEKTGGILEVELREVELSDKDLKNANMKAGKYISFKVSDTGVGIKPENLKNIFNPYFTTKEKGKGTGLGLSIVHNIIKSHKGDIQVESELGKGTTFKIFLPVVNLDSNENLEEDALDLLRGNERILVVDDEINMLSLLKEMLSRLGYKVVTQNSSLDALELFKEKPMDFDVVVSDLTMPKMTGELLAQKLKEVREDIPIIICTGFSDDLGKDFLESNILSAFLMKPVPAKILAKEIRKALGDTLD